MPAGDSRKEFILATAGNFFGVAVTDSGITHAHDAPALNNFLDDGSVAILAATMQEEGTRKVCFTNKVHNHICCEKTWNCIWVLHISAAHFYYIGTGICNALHI